MVILSATVAKLSATQVTRANRSRPNKGAYNRSYLTRPYARSEPCADLWS